MGGTADCRSGREDEQYAGQAGKRPDVYVRRGVVHQETSLDCFDRGINVLGINKHPYC
jgi:hypothetical protein